MGHWIGRGLLVLGTWGEGLSLRKRIVIQNDDHKQCLRFGCGTANTKRRADTRELSTREKSIRRALQYIREPLTFVQNVVGQEIRASRLLVANVKIY